MGIANLVRIQRATSLKVSESVTNSQACGCCLKELKDFRKFSISDDVFFRLATELAKLQNHLYKAQSPFLEPGMPDGVAGS